MGDTRDVPVFQTIYLVPYADPLILHTGLYSCCAIRP